MMVLEVGGDNEVSVILKLLLLLGLLFKLLLF